MPQNYVPIFIFIAIVGSLLPITLLLAKLVRPSNPSKAKLMPYECGIDPMTALGDVTPFATTSSRSCSSFSTWKRFSFFPGRLGSRRLGYLDCLKCWSFWRS